MSAVMEQEQGLSAQFRQLDEALKWWAKRDDLGGFRTVGRELFPDWFARAGCGLAPHRKGERLPYFSISCSNSGAWYFKDWTANETGGLVRFVMLSGMDLATAGQWLIERTEGKENDEARMTNDERNPNDEVRMKPQLENPNITVTMKNSAASHHVNGVSNTDSSIATNVIPITAAIPAASDGYPQPMGAAAFHGVAGEIVRLIEPHTEADPAALLFQLLTAFGNIIGRDTYMIADGARHGLNLFGVLVGQSSKGRKGTSWNHVAALLERIDEDWKAARVTSGLSSGEGLIYNVRDPITVPKPDDEKPGEYRQVVSDSGVGDKRLMVVEGEFANTLKVMERETNTLSPVIRAAWDSGSLRTLTKNAPVKSTGAHISIIGHITRDELRRLLGAVEAANGFANRFCWLAVRRSKCLPEGGRIDTVDFNNVVMRLKTVIDFARTAGELTRDDAARDLWRGIYPLLSEGKPGLLGAVTGRAEAQVMRLSALYALLDGSRVIRPAHHYAAMAVWSYSEQSARWIFGTATGDKNADKILAALKLAGREGMLKSEIGDKVFLRNLPSAGLSDALTTLKQAGLATYTKETTRGGPAERWFSSDEPTS